MNLHLADPKTLTPEIFRIFVERGALLTAGDRAGCNTMTVGWCQAGTLWNVPTCTVYVRPERYTYAFMEANDYFTVSVFPEGSKKIMAYCGSKSGRDTDKIEDCDLTLCYGEGDAPFFEEAELVLVCKKIYAQDLDAACVVQDDPILPFYQKGGWHRAYTGKVVEAYIR
ncbi:MAG: flavin reductase family protein [Ruminococcaceae bacterium]|nr:flavin reductase family protein [Oscillospiraceae bacterium]